MQDYPQMEHIVIDGASTDGSLELIKQYAPRLAYWVSEPDSGIYAAMNKGAAVAKGDYLIFLNAGDTFLCPTALKEAVEHFPDPPVDIHYGKVVFETPKGRHRLKQYPKVLSLEYLAWESINHQAMFFHKALFDRFKYDETLKINADWKFYLQAIFLHGATTHYLGFAFSFFGYGGISSSAENQELFAREREQVLQTTFPELYPKLKRRKLRKEWFRMVSGHNALYFLAEKMYYLFLRIQGK